MLVVNYWEDPDCIGGTFINRFVSRFKLFINKLYVWNNNILVIYTLTSNKKWDIVNIFFIL